MSSTISAPKESRLSIRANASQKTALARAARAQHMNISQFVLQSSLSAAQKVIEAETRIEVSAQEYEWLCEIMDAPPAPAPRLRAVLRQKPVWND